jgi:hypothetical protein
MKILIILLLCSMALIVGCSNSSKVASSLWQERQMDDNQRIHGSPYESSYDGPGQWQSVWLPTPY